eukprot:931607-Pyramimonas_sp.AAC.1
MFSPAQAARSSCSVASAWASQPVSRSQSQSVAAAVAAAVAVTQSHSHTATQPPRSRAVTQLRGRTVAQPRGNTVAESRSRKATRWRSHAVTQSHSGTVCHQWYIYRTPAFYLGEAPKDGQQLTVAALQCGRVRQPQRTQPPDARPWSQP